MDDDLIACDYSEAIQRVGGDIALLSQVMALFLDEMPKMMAAIRKYATDKNSRLLWNECHKMKGASSHFGAAEMVHILEQIEASAKVEDFPAVINFMDTLSKASIRFKECISRWHNDPGNTVIL